MSNPTTEELSEEQAINDLGCNAPRVKTGDFHDKIKSIDIVEHTTRSGSVLRWAVLEMENGFSITGKPSASVSAENDRPELGKQYAIENAVREVWAFEGYLLKEQLFQAAKL
jgi:hypothetical protein